MSTVTVTIPETTHATDFEIRMIVACRLFEDGRLSSGQAAEMVGLSKRAFLELAGKYGVSVFGYSIQEIEEDLRHA